jgi:hypothetical protein
MTTKNEQNEPCKYYCELCDYDCCKKYNYERHILTAKHIKTTKAIKNEKLEQNDKYKCNNCNKIYKDRAGLWRHKKKCIENIESDSSYNEIKMLTNLVLEVVKQNQELISQNNEVQKQNQELQKNVIEALKNGTNNNTNINSNNKTFNLQVFLNETCKDAMNIMDFVDSIKIQLTDIESIGELGYVNGMSKLIIKHLNALDENMRPVHCSDPKRDSLYVKDKNVWEKEDPDNKKIKKAIKYISNKNICALPEWKAKYPDCIYSDSLKSDQYNHIVLEAMGGSGDNDAEKADKIVKKIAKVVTIDKNN